MYKAVLTTFAVRTAVLSPFATKLPSHCYAKAIFIFALSAFILTYFSRNYFCIRLHTVCRLRRHRLLHKCLLTYLMQAFCLRLHSVKPFPNLRLNGAPIRFVSFRCVLLNLLICFVFVLVLSYLFSCNYLSPMGKKCLTIAY